MRAWWTISALLIALPALGCAYPEYSIDDGLGGPDLEPPPPTCGSHNTMVGVPGRYCIDSTEVSWAQYLDAPPLNPLDLPDLPNLPESCGSLMLMEGLVLPNRIECEPPEDLNRPVVCVSWCQAHLYCQLAGKELCGRIGGGANEFTAHDDAEASQWFNACSAGESRAYPYGNSYDGDKCYTQPRQGAEAGQLILSVPVGDEGGCQATGDVEYEGVFDLSGNVAEWVDECRSGSGCRIRGGAAYYWQGGDSAARMSCAAADYLDPGEAPVDYVGFRCCYTPEPPAP